ncbi:MAG: DUF4124 domain-containing protein [Accumulibacter sp.]|uniref:DUF4124 domain-containing protein n=1 Tax=Accumulibacter sp. TaxID=2053492 RepID=UPI002FC2DB89
MDRGKQGVPAASGEWLAPGVGTSQACAPASRVLPRQRPGRLARAWLSIIALSVLPPVLATAQTIYRWVDEHGRTHYSEHSPEQERAGVVDCPPPPSAQEVEEARKRSERSRSEAERLQRDRQSRDSRERPYQPKDLGPLPLNAASELMATRGTGCLVDWREAPLLKFAFTLNLNLHENVPAGALIEAEFENPLDPADPLRSSVVVEVSGKTQVKQLSVSLMSPSVTVIQCRNYLVRVRAYRDAKSREVLDTLEQQIQSRVDSTVWQQLGEEYAIERLSLHGHVCR